jgi:hypothetical protein
METIYHLAQATDWASAGDEYAFTTVGVPLEQGGFTYEALPRTAVVAATPWSPDWHPVS